MSQNYDGNGNPTDFLQYDLNDRLVNASLGNATNVLSTYRSDGLRAKKQINVGGNTGAPTYFLYDGTRVVCELDSGGNVLAAYGYGGAGLAQRYSSTTGTYTAYTFDPTGNVVSRMLQLDAAGHPYDLSDYDAFGQRLAYQIAGGQANSAVPPDAVGYGGQFGNITDVEANLILMGFRFYSPQYCRFLTRDPAGYEGGINLYAYCRNNPINRFDPTGLQGTTLLMGPEQAQQFISGAGHVASAVNDTLANNTQLAQQVAATSAFTGSALYTYVGGASTLGPVGVAAVAIPLASYGAYKYIGTPLANSLFGPQTLGSSVDPAYSSIFNRLRNCFVAGTLIAMADGTYKPIEQIKEGDKVLSRDPFTKQTAARQVVQTFAREVEQTLVLRFGNGETIETTPGHPFYVEGKGFVLAGQLGLGNAIVTRAGPAAIVTGIQNNSERVRVYNLEVADFHTYFVGSLDGGLLVHNDSQIVTVIGRNADVDAYIAKNYTGRPFNLYRVDPSMYKLSDNLQWIRDAVARGDKIILATDPAKLSRTHDPGVPNGYYSWLELRELLRLGKKPNAGFLK